MSAPANADTEGVVSKVQVKKEIKTIVENLETILGDLKDVAKELKEVKGQETLTVMCVITVTQAYLHMQGSPKHTLSSTVLCHNYLQHERCLAPEDMWRRSEDNFCGQTLVGSNESQEIPTAINISWTSWLNRRGRCFCVRFHHLNAGCCSPHTHSRQIARARHISRSTVGGVSASSSSDFNFILVFVSFHAAALFPPLPPHLSHRSKGLWQPHKSQRCRNVGNRRRKGESGGMFSFYTLLEIRVRSNLGIKNSCHFTCNGVQLLLARLLYRLKGLRRTCRGHPARWVRTLNRTWQAVILIKHNCTQPLLATLQMGSVCSICLPVPLSAPANMFLQLEPIVAGGRDYRDRPLSFRVYFSLRGIMSGTSTQSNSPHNPAGVSVLPGRQLRWKQVSTWLDLGTLEDLGW